MAFGHEQGWSSTLDRKAMRFLAKIVASRTITLPAGRTIASITFDDVPDSAALVGAPILERHGARGTFYIAGATCGVRDALWTVVSREQVRAIHDAGHEIACHTANHVNVQSLNSDALNAECDLNAALLGEICGNLELTNFAYPFGDLGLRQRTLLQGRFASCRTIYEFSNMSPITPGRLGAIGLFDATKTREWIRRLIESARGRGGWLVFYTHDVSQSPTFMGTSPALLRDTLFILADAGIPVMTMRQALAAFAQNPRT
jgi:peptidoglycan/xylan/chitin deacetylase (PgdA/CDA1 family)